MMSTPKRRVLVVDDDPCIRAVFGLVFEQEGYEVAEAADGQVALDLLGSWRPDAIVLDLMMPVMDGPSFRAEQLKREDTADIPVVVVSSSRSLDQQTMQLCDLDVLHKPCDVDLIVDTVQRATARYAS